MTTKKPKMPVQMAFEASTVRVAIAAVLQGGYVLARAADSEEPFNQAIAEALALLAHAR